MNVFSDKRTLGSLIVIGLTAGIIGIIFTHLLETVQEIVFGYDEALMTFREATERATPFRRLYALLACGLVAGIGWTTIHRYGARLVDIKDAVHDPKAHMPVVTTLAHAVLQIITVGMGSPMGREVAPREATAALTGGLFRYTKPDAETKVLLVACASGAGLAAVYNAPLSASIFVLETMLFTWNPRALAAALIACGTAVWTVRLGLGDVVQYAMPNIPVTTELASWAVAAGPVLALCIVGLERTTRMLPRIDRAHPRMIAISVAAFGAIGLLSMYYPEILGNGKSANELTFAAATTWNYALGIMLAKWAAVLLATGAGAYGGRITPAMLWGSTAALVMATGWSYVVAPIPIGAAAFVGAVVFLGIAQKMYVTATVFMMELTRFSVEYLYPITLCMGTGLLTYHLLQSRSAAKGEGVCP